MTDGELLELASRYRVDVSPGEIATYREHVTACLAALRRLETLYAGEEDLPAVRDPGAPRSHRIGVEGAVIDGVLRMGFFHGAAVYRPETVARLAEAYAAALRALVQHCRTGRAEAFTPDDFPAARIDQDELDDLLAQLDEA